MYSLLFGYLLDKTTNTVVVLCNDVGYEVTVPLSTYEQLPAIGTKVVIFTYLRVTEDSQTLYGFAHPAEKLIFLELLKINKVGPKVALSILGMYDLQRLLNIVELRDVDRLSKVPGVGKLTAEKIIVELKNRQEQLFDTLSLGKAHIESTKQALAQMTIQQSHHPFGYDFTHGGMQQQQLSGSNTVSTRQVYGAGASVVRIPASQVSGAGFDEIELLDQQYRGKEVVEQTMAEQVSMLQANPTGLETSMQGATSQPARIAVATDATTHATTVTTSPASNLFIGQQDFTDLAGTGSTLNVFTLRRSPEFQIVLGALVGLGLKEAQAEKMASEVYQEGLTGQELVRRALELYRSKK